MGAAVGYRNDGLQHVNPGIRPWLVMGCYSPPPPDEPERDSQLAQLAVALVAFCAGFERFGFKLAH